MKKVLIVAIGMVMTNAAAGQTDTAKKSTTVFNWSMDTYYRYDFNDAPASTNNLTCFTNSKNSFELGMVTVRADHSFGKVSATADLGFGKRAQDFSYHDVNTSAVIKQLFISYAPSRAVKLTVGKWATHIGYEMADAYLNRNYSMSYAFSYGPFFHTGVRADVSIGGKTACMIGIANPTDFSTTTSPVRVLIAQFSTGTGNDKLKAFLNFQGGKDVNQFDLVLNAVLSTRFSIAYDGTIYTIKNGSVKNRWTANVLYFNYDPSKIWGLTLRNEYFADGKNAAGIGTSIVETTFSGNIHLNNLTVIPEIRMDNAGAPVFSKNTGAGTTHTAGFIIAVVYKF